ncbi:hypothetical protein RB601_004336 [Gaeumannomyces tritici]
MLLPLGLLYLASLATAQGETGNNPGWPRWCGKVYKPGYPSFEPGGETVAPPEVPGPAQLHVQFRPRYNLYLDNEAEGHFVVNAELSRHHGSPLDESRQSPGTAVAFSITLNSTGAELASGSVAVNSTRNLVPFDLSGVPTSLAPQLAVLRATVAGQAQAYVATAELLRLPDKRRGSVTRIDNLGGGLQFRNSASNHTFGPLLPYGYYASYDGFLRLNDTGPVRRYADLGLTAMTPLTVWAEGGDKLRYMDDIGLPFMYSLRDGYRNLTYVAESVAPVVDSEALYAYWTADEPDGWQHPFAAPARARDVVRALDPYHPVAVTLNCQDYHFGEYAGDGAADVVMEDVYPLIASATFSKWGTECNRTYGDCGCDNCAGGVRDVARRLDDLARHERALGRWPKPKFHNTQSFSGEGYWPRDPTPAESWAMNVLAFNHGATGIVAWVYPASDVLAAAHGRLSRVVASPPVVDFLVGAGDNGGPHPVAVPGLGADEIDVAYWTAGGGGGGDGRLLVAVVNPSATDDRVGDVVVRLPRAAARIDAVPWGSPELWVLADGGGTLRAAGNFSAMSTAMILLTLA